MFLQRFFKAPRVYLDYAAATPARASVRQVMEQYASDTFANPSAIHKEGRAARRAVEASRETVARLLKIRTEDVVFTSGGTEANNLAIFGVVEAARARGTRYEDMEIISTAIEHPSVRETLAACAEKGVVVRDVTVDEDGRIVMHDFEDLLSHKTVLVTFAYANSEVGVVQDVKRITRTVRALGEVRPYVHLDASQAPLWLPLAMDMLGVDLMTLDAGKCYGPKGVGVLARRHHVVLRPSIYGGDQEKGLRPGTENVPLIVGCAKALEIASDGVTTRAARVVELREYFIKKLLEEVDGAVVNGSREHRIANNVNISVKGIDGEFAVVTLDVQGVAASTRSACAGGKGGGSHVVRTLTKDEERAASTIRFTLGEETTKGDIDRAVSVLAAHVKKSAGSLDWGKK